ncbi:MAG TPA: hypothetical protein VFS20_08815 [Longimicrobium sp.]|nr:hypothetical protein [Longimicrobium sp.]
MHPAAVRLAVLLLSLVIGGDAAAQNLHAAVPPEGPDAGWFVPPGWQAAHEARGDLNRDGQLDVALHLVPTGFRYESDPVATAPASHGLIVLLAERGGGLRRAGLTTVLLPEGVPRYGLGLEIRRGVLVVRQSFGAEAATELTHRFRHDPATGRFVLIRREQHTRSPQGDSELRRDDYLAGVLTVTVGRRDPSGRYRETTRREARPRTKFLLEHVVEQPGG